VASRFVGTTCQEISRLRKLITIDLKFILLIEQDEFVSKICVLGCDFMNGIPEEFIDWLYVKRRELIEKILRGKASEQEVYLGFLRHTPAIATYGSAGLNASVKGIGFIHEDKYLPETLEILREYMKEKRSQVEALKFLLEHIYLREKIDFTKLTSIELARKHTWINVSENPVATIVFYYPPMTSYEVRCKVEIHLDDDVHEFVNRIHDLYHSGKPRKEKWSSRPVYMFRIQEIYDNSPIKMGQKIY